MFKKKLYARLCSIAVLITMILFTVLGIRIRNKAETVMSGVAATAETPVIVIDPGHGGEDGGATAADGTLEKDLNLSIALKLKKFFELNGFDTVMTRDSDISISDDLVTVKERKTSDLKKRVEIFNSSQNNVIISIHQNKFEQSKYYGTQIFYSSVNSQNQKLAEFVRESVISLLQPENTRVSKTDDSLFILKNCQNPAIIIECGFVSNPDELTKLKSDDYQNKLAFSILAGGLQFYAQNWK